MHFTIALVTAVLLTASPGVQKSPPGTDKAAVSAEIDRELAQLIRKEPRLRVMVTTPKITQFAVEEVVVKLDGMPLQGHDGKIYEGMVEAGPHLLDVEMRLKGRSRLFRYLDGYALELKKNAELFLSEGQSMDVTVRLSSKGKRISWKKRASIDIAARARISPEQEVAGLVPPPLAEETAALDLTPTENDAALAAAEEKLTARPVTEEHEALQPRSIEGVVEVTEIAPTPIVRPAAVATPADQVVFPDRVARRFRPLSTPSGQPVQRADRAEAVVPGEGSFGAGTEEANRAASD